MSAPNQMEQLMRQSLYKPHELADLLEMPEEEILREIHQGRLKANMLEHKVLHISREAVLEWLEKFH